MLITKLAPTLFVALGGALGASARFWVREYLPAITGTEFPFSTLVVNVVGCFLAGLVYMWLESSDAHWNVGKLLFFFVGFLGAFTTFSAFALDSLLLFNQGESLKLFVNVLANCLLCLICVFVGAWLGGRIATG
ncbi:fluoride efflux transporter CrcB [Aliikangiella coralliicola]|uniref:Fluoride-specific ion channel FluC n=1 Tax=Aliikangiella coralliicola TaxID=2592383 RepID=A0A545UAL1_9GAMM|nr:fluoride efflux transporter CrcB [Aliikangiella coralliicola]TQV86504.1 fluoride efflux transporter CrcB [Aliikangiella coralliicola]